MAQSLYEYGQVAYTLEHPPEWKDLVPDEQRAIMALLLLVSEVVECSDAVLEASEEHEAEELADIFIRLVDYAAWRGIDLADAVDAKMAVNKTRPYKHGKRF
jgi:NTP pyrophosphatase (non-canonical NTP hydrolase)